MAREARRTGEEREAREKEEARRTREARAKRMCSREVLASHSALRLAELEQTTVGLHQVTSQNRVTKATSSCLVMFSTTAREAIQY